MEQIIHGEGWECPKPIIETKRLLDTMGSGTVTTIVDNEIAVRNLVNFSESLGYLVEITREGELSYVQVTKEKDPDEVLSKSGDIVILINSDTFGEGARELGESLMKAYLYALTEVEPKPKTLLFVNSGVFFTTQGSSVEDSLYALEAEGVEIITCGACLNFYDLTEKLIVGSIGNMYLIAEKLNHAGNAIKI